MTMILNKDKKIKMQQEIIDKLSRENEELKEQLEFERAKPDLMIHKAKEMMELLEEKKNEYEYLVAELKELKEKYRSQLKEFKELKIKYRKHIKNM